MGGETLHVNERGRLILCMAWWRRRRQTGAGNNGALKVRHLNLCHAHHDKFSINYTARQPPDDERRRERRGVGWGVGGDSDTTLPSRKPPDLF